MPSLNPCLENTIGLGDELLVTGHCRLLQQSDPRKVKLEYGKRLWNEVFDHNPRIARAGDRDVQIYYPRPNGLRPYIAGKSLDKWTWLEYTPPVGELYFQPDELAMSGRYAPDIVIEPNIKNRASPNKQWGFERWARLVQLMRAAKMRPGQLGQIGTKVIPGAEFMVTTNFRRACAVLRKARAVVTHEGGMHHAAAVVGVPAVVIYGGYISPRSTGYDLHRNLFIDAGGHHMGCGMRIPCRHCEHVMERITPEMVFEELKAIL